MKENEDGTRTPAVLLMLNDGRANGTVIGSLDATPANQHDRCPSCNVQWLGHLNATPQGMTFLDGETKLREACHGEHILSMGTWDGWPEGRPMQAAPQIRKLDDATIATIAQNMAPDQRVARLVDHIRWQQAELDRERVAVVELTRHAMRLKEASSRPHTEHTDFWVSLYWCCDDTVWHEHVGRVHAIWDAMPPFIKNIINNSEVQFVAGMLGAQIPGYVP